MEYCQRMYLKIYWLLIKAYFCYIHSYFDQYMSMFQIKYKNKQYLKSSCIYVYVKQTQ